MYLFLLMLMAGFLTLVSNRKHLLNMLLSLEFIMLSLFFGVMLILSKNVFENYFSFYFLTFVACEGALGLSVLISIMRTHGNDYFLLYNSVQW